jgi:hypothetical protein
LNSSQPNQGKPSPDSLQFVAVRKGIKQGPHYVAMAKSSTMARRIANALNQYKPNAKGY